MDGCVASRSCGTVGALKSGPAVESMLATGSYDANRRLIGWFDEFDPVPPVGAPRNQGDGMVMALEHGSAFCVAHWNLSIKLSYQVEGERVDGQPFLRVAGPREMAYPHSLIINRSGRRFADESTFGDVAIKLREFDFRTHRLTNVPCWLVFDLQYFQKYGLPPIPPGSEAPEWLPRSDTISNLAERIGVDATQLTETIDRFNGFVLSGNDADFHRGEMPWARQVASDLKQRNPNLGSISNPPYFALRCSPARAPRWDWSPTELGVSSIFVATLSLVSTRAGKWLHGATLVSATRRASAWLARLPLGGLLPSMRPKRRSDAFAVR